MSDADVMNDVVYLLHRMHLIGSVTYVLATVKFNDYE